MRDQKFPAAGGFILAITATAGALWGAGRGQVYAGLLIGVAVGAAIAVVIWLVDRRR